MIQIKIKKELCDLIEQLHYETLSLKDLILFLLNNEIDIKNESYKYILNLYIEKNMEYLLAKENLKKDYFIPDCSWELNFESNLLTYEDKNND